MSRGVSACSFAAGWLLPGTSDGLGRIAPPILLLWSRQDGGSHAAGPFLFEG